MERRDFLMAQLEQMGKALAHASARLIGLVPADQLEIQKVGEELNGQLDFDVHELIGKSMDEIGSWFNDHELSFEIAESIADYLSNLYTAKSANGISALKTAKYLLVLADKETKSFSMERAKKMMEIDRELLDQ